MIQTQKELKAAAKAQAKAALALLTKQERTALSVERRDRFVDLIVYSELTKAEALERIAEEIAEDRYRSLKAEAARLDALDTTEFGEWMDSAACNAADTCKAQGVPSSGQYGRETLAFLEAYVVTLSMVLDSNGIAH